ncbi:MAG: hypothetical protein Q9160_008393 [Pyrenula sp. 1 TL-2023]
MSSFKRWLSPREPGLQLMHLPSELREQILYHLLVRYPRQYNTRRCRSTGITIRMTERGQEVSNPDFQGLSAQVLRTNKKLYAEGLPLLYGANVFNLESLELRFTAPITTGWARVFPEHITLIRHIDIVDLRLRYLSHIFSMSPDHLIGGFLDRALQLETMRILVHEVYDVPGFDASDLELVTDAKSEARNRSVSEQYQKGVILEASRLLGEAGWQVGYWYEAKEKYYVEPVFYVTKHPLKKIPSTPKGETPVRFAPLQPFHAGSNAKIEVSHFSSTRD